MCYNNIIPSNPIPIFFFTDAAISTSEEMMVGLGRVVKNYKGEIIAVDLARDVELAEAEGVYMCKMIKLMIRVFRIIKLC